MKVAIVGTSTRLSENEERDVRQYCSQIIKSYDIKNTKIISGGAKGVDTIAIEIANSLFYKTEIYHPLSNTWIGYKERNIRLASDCDELFCITTPVHKSRCYHHFPPQEHQKTAGCFTLKHAKNFGKTTTLFVTPKR